MDDGLTKKYQELQELEKTRAGLTKIIVHDLNNLLAVILGNLQLIKMSGEENFTQEQKRDLEMAVSGGDDMQRMIEGLLAIGKMEEGALSLNCEGFRLDHAVSAAVDKMKRVAQYDEKTVSFEAAREMPAILADKKLIQFVVENLIKTALKLAPPKSAVHVKVFYDAQAHSFSVQVTDAGKGIPEEYLSRVFEKFVEVGMGRKLRINCGLELTFCKIIIDLHGGKIWMENTQDKGSRFTFLLPEKKG